MLKIYLVTITTGVPELNKCYREVEEARSGYIKQNLIICLKLFRTSEIIVSNLFVYLITYNSI